MATYSGIWTSTQQLQSAGGPALWPGVTQPGQQLYQGGAGSTSAGGCMKIYADMIKFGMIDAVVATGASIEEAYDMAFSCDPKSAFGGIASFNREISAEIAEKLRAHFYEVIIAPSFALEAKEILLKKPNLRLLEAKPLNLLQYFAVKGLTGGALVQMPDFVEPEFEAAAGELEKSQMENYKFSFKAVKFFKSNAIAITCSTRVIAFGCGQTSRVDAVEIACKKLAQTRLNPADCILSGDAFFPFTDGLEVAKKAGIKTVIAPAGSIRDNEIKEYSAQNGINLIFAKTRHFRH
jgi:phosphoribosylaminoimidazolecarboxamide formyltransferase/IMP cyclohydrolase